ncbi:MAG: hypothetical protein RIR00_1265, partial [Pseudomonadota bacterium]|jgi:hypothetical protein
VPWPALVALIEPHYPKAGKGRRPRGLETMLRIYFMQQWFALSDPGMEDALYDVPCMRGTTGDGTTGDGPRFRPNIAPIRFRKFSPCRVVPVWPCKAFLFI